MTDRRELPPGSVEVLASRLDATVAQWRARLRSQILGNRAATHPATDIATAQTDLREQLGAIELQVVEIERSLDREISKASEAEQRQWRRSVR